MARSMGGCNQNANSTHAVMGGVNKLTAKSGKTEMGKASSGKAVTGTSNGGRGTTGKRVKLA